GRFVTDRRQRDHRGIRRSTRAAEPTKRCPERQYHQTIGVPMADVTTPKSQASHLEVQTPSEQRAEAEAIFTSIGEGAIATDEFGRITRINPVALQILGYTKPQELIGSWFPGKIIAVTANDAPLNLIDRPITKAFLTGSSVTEKMYYRRKDGKIVPVAVSVSPILLDGKPLG